MTNATDTEDPRVSRSRLAVMRAVVTLLEEEGASAITHQRVAERAGVGRATVYRHWPRTQDLVHDAIRSGGGIRLLSLPDGPLPERLRAGVRKLATDLRAPVTAALIATMLEQALWDDNVRQRRRELGERVVEEVSGALDTALERGEIARLPDARRFVAQILGPCMFTNLILDEAVSDALIHTVVDAAIAPLVTGEDFAASPR